MKKVDNCAVNFKFREYVDDVRTDLGIMLSEFYSFGNSEKEGLVEREYNNCMNSIKIRISELINITCFLSGAEVITLEDCCNNCSYIHSVSEELYKTAGKIYIDKVRALKDE